MTSPAAVSIAQSPLASMKPSTYPHYASVLAGFTEKKDAYGRDRVELSADLQKFLRRIATEPRVVMQEVGQRVKPLPEELKALHGSDPREAAVEVVHFLYNILPSPPKADSSSPKQAGAPETALPEEFQMAFVDVLRDQRANARRIAVDNATPRQVDGSVNGHNDGKPNPDVLDTFLMSVSALGKGLTTQGKTKGGEDVKTPSLDGKIELLHADPKRFIVAQAESSGDAPMRAYQWAVYALHGTIGFFPPKTMASMKAALREQASIATSQLNVIHPNQGIDVRR